MKIDCSIIEMKQALESENINRAKLVMYELEDQIELFFDGVKPILTSVQEIGAHFSAIDKKVNNENFMKIG